MLAKTFRNRAPDGARAQDFSARVDYICGKADAISLANIAGNWREAAWQMRIAAGLNPRVRSAVCHYILTWADSEKPTNAEMIDSAHRVVHELGGHEHQYVIAVHTDRPHPHVHIVLNRVHPITGQALSLSHDYARLEKACRRIEFEMSWPPDRGRFDCEIIDGDVHLIPKPAAHWRQKTADREQGFRHDGRAVRGHERRTGLPALRDALPKATLEKLRLQLDQCRTWAEVHITFMEHQLRYVLHRGGARISRIASNWAMPACHLGARYGLKRMISRLGDFVSAAFRDQGAATPDSKTSETQINPAFAQLKQALPIARSIIRTQRDSAEQRHVDRKALVQRQIAERRHITQLLNEARDAGAEAIRNVLRDFHFEERAALRQASPSDQQSVDLTPLLETQIPAVMHARRYRHILRRVAQKQAGGPGQAYADHTALRQAWSLPAPISTGDMPEDIAIILSHFSENIRLDQNGHLIFSRRNPADGIGGFEALNLATLMPVPCRNAASGRGLRTLGPRDSTHVILVPDSASALLQMIASEAPYPQIVTVDRIPDAAAAWHLRQITEGRACSIALGQQPEVMGIRKRLGQILPDARYRKLAGRELIGMLREQTGPRYSQIDGDLTPD